MPIVLVRVDDRLIHGQVLEGWLPTTRAQEVLIANDALADDPLQRIIMEAAVPDAIHLVVDRVERIAEILLSDGGENDVRRMILVDDPVDALRLKRAGVRFDRLNLGNFRARECTTCLSRSVVVGSECLRILSNILAEGVRINIQSVPFEKPVDLTDLSACLVGFVGLNKRI